MQKSKKFQMHDYATKASPINPICPFTNASALRIAFCSNGSMTVPTIAAIFRTRVRDMRKFSHDQSQKILFSDPCMQGFACTSRTSAGGNQFTLCTCKAPYKSNGTVWARPDRENIKSLQNVKNLDLF